MARFRAACLAAFAAVLCTASAAYGQTVSQASGAPNPDRIASDGTDLGVSTRPANLNPLGVSYQDCIDDLTLRFTVTLSGFSGSDSLKVWASLTSDCTAATDRGIGSTAAICWLVNQGITTPVISTPQTYTFDVRVQDLVGWQAVPPSVSEAANPPRLGVEACTAQQSFAAVPININFLALNSSGQSDGTPYQYQLNTDMVGPPAPSLPAPPGADSVGDTLMNIFWNANTDSDTAGYAIFIDPIPGTEGQVVDSGVTLEAGQVLICPEASTTSSTDASGDSSGDADDGAPQPTPTPVTDASCYPINRGGTPPNTTTYCNDPILSSSISADGGAGSTVTDAGTTQVFDDAGNLIDSGASVEEGNGGISTIPSQYMITPYSGAGLTVSGKSANQYTITGLKDYQHYTVVVASVDGTGNIGPPSAEICDYPQPVQDFWQTYSTDGGGAGGFCSLDRVGVGGSSLAGVACLFAAAGLVRRRRRS